LPSLGDGAFQFRRGEVLVALNRLEEAQQAIISARATAQRVLADDKDHAGAARMVAECNALLAKIAEGEDKDAPESLPDRQSEPEPTAADDSIPPP
jgi:hypothetical protein